MSKYIYIIELTETTKSFPKKEFYKFEIGDILHTTKNLTDAFMMESEDAAIDLSEYIESNFDYSAKIIEFKRT